MRTKSVRLWSEHSPIIRKWIVKIQALWRGYFIRRILRLSGRGVLKRCICHNDDEMVTGVAKDKIHPFDYFSVEEDGKVWWFDQRSMIEWSEKHVYITNPYTRSRLSPSDCRRLRLLRLFRTRKNMAILHTEDDEIQDDEDIRDNRWLRIVQVFTESGFGDLVHPNHFVAFTYDHLKLFMNSLVEDTRLWMYERKGPEDPYVLKSKRWRYHSLLRANRNIMHTYTELEMLSRDVAGLLLSCLNNINDPSDFVFMILTALIRTGELAPDL